VLHDHHNQEEHNRMTIEIKPNNCISNDPCAICGARCDPTGIDPFLAGTQRLVCDDCARQHGEAEALDRARAVASRALDAA